MTRFFAFVGAALTLWSPWAAAIDAPQAGHTEGVAEQRIVEEWRTQRVAALTGEQGWLTLVGLFWLDKGGNSFGRAASNRLVLEHPALAPKAGTFVLDSRGIHFTAHRGSGITHAGQPVTALDMVPDIAGEPTVISSGSLRIWIIGRAGKLGVRVRDVESPRRREFTAIEYYPIDTGWVFDSRFEPYEPHRHIKIINILGLEEEMDCPGALVFSRDGHEWRLDAVLEDPHDQTLFVMFADRTNGKGTYGGGRFLRVPLPAGGTTRVDFNTAYNPPCAFNDFATCPLPPAQNHLALGVESGEKVYGNGYGGH
jgi:uncharacterized protein (DUF1684 family)